MSVGLESSAWLLQGCVSTLPASESEDPPSTSTSSMPNLSAIPNLCSTARTNLLAFLHPQVLEC